jgi:hypothetical protein
MPDFGTDILSMSDLDPSFGTVTEYALLGQDLLHRFQTDEGSLFYDPTYGYDLTTLVGETVDSRMLFRESTRIAAEAEKDERVLRAVATVTYDAGRFTVALTVMTADGPYAYLFTVAKLGVALASGA